jgi:hypothetical protein
MNPALPKAGLIPTYNLCRPEVQDSISCVVIKEEERDERKN